MLILVYILCMPATLEFGLLYASLKEECLFGRILYSLTSFVAFHRNHCYRYRGTHHYMDAKT